MRIQLLRRGAAIAFLALAVVLGSGHEAPSRAAPPGLTHRLVAPNTARDGVSGQPLPTTYVVKAGDTLFSIAGRYQTTVGVLVVANDLPDAGHIEVGQVLVIPDAAGRAGVGWDISWPQCGGAYPATPFAFAVIGINHHLPFTKNDCLADELAWARQGSFGPMLYMNSSAPPDGYENAACEPGDQPCLSYQFGWDAAAYSYAYAYPLGPGVARWWLDVETFNTPWSADTSLNAQAVRGMIDYLQSQGRIVGIYSTSYQWGVIAGSYAPGLATWIPGVAHAPADGPSACLAAPTFGGTGKPLMVQWTQTYDGDYLC